MMENVKNYPLIVMIWNGTNLMMKLVSSRSTTVSLVSPLIKINKMLSENLGKENKMEDQVNSVT